MSLKPHLAPIKIAVIPLKRNENSIVKTSIDLKNDLQRTIEGRILLENTGNIGKNYRKHDEIGTPACITVDFQTLEDNSVTIRDRDTMDQKRLKIDEIRDFLTLNYNI